LAGDLARRWACEFTARSGGRAWATFISRDDAKRFAERHARTFLAPAGTSLMWDDADDSSVLTTQLGHYVVTSIDEPG
jgi:hypothetical protein